jgi:transposase
MKLTTIGIDLAKNAFQVHGVDAHGKASLKERLKRGQLVAFFANLPPCLIGMEACGSAHYWARKLQALGHTVRLIALQFVNPMSRPVSMMQPMPERFVRRSCDPTCVSCQSRRLSSRGLALHWARQGCSRPERRKPTRSAACPVNSA